jgi:hypothetical protein
VWFDGVFERSLGNVVDDVGEVYVSGGEERHFQGEDKEAGRLFLFLFLEDILS